MDHMVDRNEKPFPIQTIELVFRLRYCWGCYFYSEKCNAIHSDIKLDNIMPAFSSLDKEKQHLSTKNVPEEVMDAEASGLDAFELASRFCQCQ